MYPYYEGRTSRAEQTPNGQKLTNTKETAIGQWIPSLDKRDFSPNLRSFYAIDAADPQYNSKNSIHCKLHRQDVWPWRLV